MSRMLISSLFAFLLMFSASNCSDDKVTEPAPKPEPIECVDYADYVHMEGGVSRENGGRDRIEMHVETDPDILTPGWTPPKKTLSVSFTHVALTQVRFNTPKLTHVEWRFQPLLYGPVSLC